jgi:hypothetical protein
MQLEEFFCSRSVRFPSRVAAEEWGAVTVEIVPDQLNLRPEDNPFSVDAGRLHHLCWISHGQAAGQFFKYEHALPHGFARSGQAANDDSQEHPPQLHSCPPA